MKTDHTPEPWRIGTPPPNGEQTIGNEKGLMVAVATTGHGVSAEANARRIVACVNACEDILDYELSLGCVARLSEQLRTITKQRDELLVKVAAWEQKAANWMASPEAAQRLDGYRDLAQRLNIAEQQRDELLKAMIHIQQVACSGSPELGIATNAIASAKEKQNG